MIFYENHLLAEDSHEISYLIFFRKIRKMSQKLSSVAAVIGALRVKTVVHFQAKFETKTARLKELQSLLNDSGKEVKELQPAHQEAKVAVNDQKRVARAAQVRGSSNKF